MEKNMKVNLISKNRISEYLKDSNPKYVDILMGEHGDEKRFVDMYTIIHKKCNDEAYEFKDRIILKIKTYFEEVLKAINYPNKQDRLTYLSKYIHEAKYTSLGFSVDGYGKGFGEDKFNVLVNSIKNSAAYQSNFINDILDAELYVESIGVDMISDLVTNLIQDVLGEYTENKLNELAMADKLRYNKMHYWDEIERTWKIKEIATVSYSEKIGAKEYNYLLVPECFTCDENQKQKIMAQIFNGYVYDKFKYVILNDEEKYGKYVTNFANKDRDVYKKSIAKFLNDEIGQGVAKEGDGYLTSKGILDLVQRYEDIKDFIEKEIKE